MTPSLSVEMLQKVLANHPEYLLAQRTLGNVYSLQGAYAKATDAYGKYMAADYTPPTTWSIMPPPCSSTNSMTKQPKFSPKARLWTRTISC